MSANELAECVSLTEIMDLKQEIREHHLETKFNISMNSRCSEGEQNLVFHSECCFENVMCKVKHFFPG